MDVFIREFKDTHLRVGDLIFYENDFGKHFIDVGLVTKIFVNDPNGFHNIMCHISWQKINSPEEGWSAGYVEDNIKTHEWEYFPRKGTKYKHD